MRSAEPTWTTADVPSQAGRLAIVTGGNSGIGLEAAKALAIAGADVILATRSAAKGDEAVSTILRAAPGASVWRESLDLADLRSIRAFSDERHQDGRPIDLLVNNAGIMAIPKRTETVDGFEMQLGTNFLGHYALTGLLLDLVLAAEAPRVVTVSSGAANIGKIDLDDLQSERRYRAWKAYCQSKLADSIALVELDRRARVAGWKLRSTGAHPGFARTNLQTTGPMLGKRGPLNLVALAGKLPGISHDAVGGAMPTVRAATDPGASSGDYFGPAGLGNATGPPVRNGITSRAKDFGLNDALIARAAALTGVDWPAPRSTPAT